MESFLIISNILLLLVAFLSFALGVAVLLGRESGKPLAHAIAVIVFGIAVWTFVHALYRYSQNATMVFYLARALHLVPIIIPLAFFQLVQAFLPAERKKWLQWSWRVLVVWAVILAALLLTTDLIVDTVIVVYGGEHQILFGNLYVTYIAFLICSFGISLLVFYRRIGTILNQKLRVQALYILFLSLTASTIAIVTNVILPWIGIFSLNWVGNVTTLFFIGYVFYDVVQQHAFNVRVAIAETFVVVLWIVLFFRAFLADTIVEGVVGALVFIASIILGVLLTRSVLKEVENREKGERLARYLANANARLRELDKQKTEFISIASHQLRGPIAAIVGYTSLMRDGSYGVVPKGLKEPVSRIFESGKRISIMVDDFLNVTRIEQGRMSYNLKEADLTTMVRKAVDEMRVVGEQRGLTITFTAQEEEPIMIQADESKLSQVFQNLVDNAIKYTPEGSVRVVLRKSKDGTNALVTVADTGIGIAEEELHNLFQKFNRASNANTVSVYGAGLGLYIAKEIVRAHNGYIHISSPGVGKGTTFTVELPLGEGGTQRTEEERDAHDDGSVLS